MSLLPKETIKIIGESIGITMSDEIAGSMAPDVEYRLREIIQESTKFMRHSKRSKLSCEDINNALRLRNLEILYGYNSKNPLNFAQAIGTKDLFYLEDRELEFSEIINAPLPKCPRETTLSSHWLSIEGVQPTIIQNPLPEEDLDKKRKTSTSSSLPKVKVKPLVKHLISQELQVYYEKITSVFKCTDQELIDGALHSLTNDPGLHLLLPYFVQFVSDEVTHNLYNLTYLTTLMRLLKSLLDSPYLQIEPYIHQMMPPLLTCLVGKKLCDNPNDNHWALRIYSSKIVSHICKRYGDLYKNLQLRVSKTLLQAFLDTSKPFSTHFGAIIGIAALGAEVVQSLLLPHITTYYKSLEKELSSQDAQKKIEAQNCFSALLHAAMVYVHQISKEFSPFFSPIEDKEKSNFMEVEKNLETRKKFAKVKAFYDELYDIFGESLFSVNAFQLGVFQTLI